MLQGVKYHRSERSSLYVSRSIRMPDTADLSQIKAKYQDGTLHLDIPKIPVSPPLPQLCYPTTHAVMPSGYQTW